jgi:hypothetical protein
VTYFVAHERELVAQEKANKQPDAGVIYTLNSCAAQVLLLAWRILGRE